MKALVDQSSCRQQTVLEIRRLANQAFSRAAGAPLVEGNHIRLLKDAQENYPAWLEAIAGAKHHIYFESYIIRDDFSGRRFADALIAKAQEGVIVRLIYDWMGGLGTASKRFWRWLRAGGVDVRCYNPPRLGNTLGWLSRDHRKMLSVDGQVGFISGLCVGKMWEGVPEKGIEPWRDTGVEIRGMAVRDMELAFAQVWAMMGDPIPEQEIEAMGLPHDSGNMSVRVVASLPSTAGMFRLDQLIAALATKRLWLTDAYFAGMSAYIQALMVAAKDGVDVRLLVPNSTDIPAIKPLSRAGYRTLLAAGVRVFEWNGTMLHAKTAVADGRWARVGSTNLNIASWFGNCELDAVIENEEFARDMEDMYLEDLTNATEIVLDAKRKPYPIVESSRQPHRIMTSGGGSMGRAAAGAVRIGNTIGAAVTDRRVLEPTEMRITTTVGAVLLTLAILLIFFPRALVYPIVVFFLWNSMVFFYKSFKLFCQSRIYRQSPDLKSEENETTSIAEEK